MNSEINYEVPDFQQQQQEYTWVYYQAYTDWQNGPCLIMTLADFIDLFFARHGLEEY